MLSSSLKQHKQAMNLNNGLYPSLSLEAS